MCGIVGSYGFASSAPVDRAALARMTASLSHRGPDDEGIFVDEEARVALGHRRLSIIDLSTGHQPMSDTRGSAVIAYNGEIYNYRELRADLERRGARFATRSDTEVLLELYRHDGEDGFSRLNGIFAFAIWDKEQRRLVCARDQLGVKPFYFAERNGLFLFASEVKALLEHPSVERAVDPDALAACLCFRYVPSPKTLFAGIEKLPPGHRLIVDAKGIDRLRYWAPSPRIDRDLSLQDATVLYRRKLEAAVQRQMVSDVPIGVMLSGGLDSGVIAAIMAEAAGGRRIQSFTVGFEGGESTNETGDAARTAEILGLEHHQVMVSAADYQSFFSDYIWHQEEPTGNESAPAVYFVAKLARERVKVLLSGQGADEPLAGYDRYKGEHYSAGLRRLPKGLREALRVAAPIAFPRQEKLRRSLEALGEPETARRFLRIFSIFGPELQERLWTVPPASEATLFARLIGEIDERRRPVAQLDGLSQLLYVDTRMWLPDDLLTVADKMTMAVGLELRVPFLDVELIELLETFPPSHKLRFFRGKYVHKEAARRWLPREIIERKKKGFANPVDRWMKKELAETFDRLRSREGSLCRTYFRSEAIEEMVRADREGRADYKRHLFLLLSLELWHQRFITRH